MAITGRCGEEVGNFLLSLGHRRVAVLCPGPVTDGWRVRYEGIARAFGRAGLPDAARLLAPGAQVEGPGAEQLRALQRYERTSQRMLRPFGDYLTDSFYANHLGPFLGAKRLQVRMAPVFEEALADRECTAWVGLSDLAARTALSFLRSRGVRVPEDISLIGFDNDAESFCHGLSSYDFNVPAVIQAVLSHILEYRARRVMTSPAPVEIPGTVMARGSTAPAPTC
jgi:DNA-binding LacI/PurR family transcriptional regulator